MLLVPRRQSLARSWLLILNVINQVQLPEHTGGVPSQPPSSHTRVWSPDDASYPSSHSNTATSPFTETDPRPILSGWPQFFSNQWISVINVVFLLLTYFLWRISEPRISWGPPPRQLSRLWCRWTRPADPPHSHCCTRTWCRSPGWCCWRRCRACTWPGSPPAAESRRCWSVARCWWADPEQWSGSKPGEFAPATTSPHLLWWRRSWCLKIYFISQIIFQLFLLHLHQQPAEKETLNWS